jgi:hypothetical protein
MIETVWNVYTWNGASFDSDGTIPAPNRNFREIIKSNTTVTSLADGDLCLERPSTKSVKNPISLNWQFKNRSELKQKLQDYVNDATGIKIECKDSGEAYDGDFFGEGFAVEGYFIGEVVAEWVVGRDGNEQLYQITAMFQPFAVS